MEFKQIKSFAAALSLALVLTACGGGNQGATNNEANTQETLVEETATETTNEVADTTEEHPTEDVQVAPARGEVSVTMVTDFGGVNDKSFNQSAHEGLQAAEADGNATFSYIESHKEADYQPNLESALDSESDIILTVGFALYEATDAAAAANPGQNYVIIDHYNDNNRLNLLGVNFADHENSFLVGYIAGMTTQTNNVGFVGGVPGIIIDRFEYGFRAGVEHAAREKDQPIEVQVQYANSFDDSAAGKNIAERMYQQGADVVFHAAGGVGVGVIEAAKENDKWVIGVDRDQSAEAPENMLVSTVKGVGDAVRLVINDYSNGSLASGDIVYTLADGDAVTIAYPTTNELVSQEVKDKTEEIRQQIIDGDIEVPENEEDAVAQGWIEKQ